MCSIVTGSVFFLPLNDHAKRVTDEQDVGAGLIAQTGKAVVVGGEHSDSLALLLHFAQL
jgi:hypothetical protein